MNGLTERQEEILNYIRNYIQHNQYSPTLRDIGKYFNITTKGVQDHVKALEKKEFITMDHFKSRTISIVSQENDSSRSIPILGNVAAGLPLLAEENLEGSILLPREIVKKGILFALYIKGESMTGAGILDGDLAIFVQQHQVESGEIAIAMVDNAITLKRIIIEKNRIALQAENPGYSPIYTQDAKILGKLVTVIRQYG